MRIRTNIVPFLLLVFSCVAVFTMFSVGADYETTDSTNPIHASTTIVIPRTDPGDILGSMLVNHRGTAAETVKIYDSSGTATNLIGTIDLSTAPIGTGQTANQYVYNLRISSGITISKSGATSDITIIWKNVR